MFPSVILLPQQRLVWRDNSTFPSGESVISHVGRWQGCAEMSVRYKEYIHTVIHVCTKRSCLEKASLALKQVEFEAQSMNKAVQ